VLTDAASRLCMRSSWTVAAAALLRRRRAMAPARPLVVRPPPLEPTRLLALRRHLALQSPPPAQRLSPTSRRRSATRARSPHSCGRHPAPAWRSRTRAGRCGHGVFASRTGHLERRLGGCFSRGLRFAEGPRAVRLLRDDFLKMIARCAARSGHRFAHKLPGKAPGWVLLSRVLLPRRVVRVGVCCGRWVCVFAVVCVRRCLLWWLG
jgi:hypothetical protein